MKIFKISTALFVFALFLCGLTTPNGTSTALAAENSTGDNSEYATYDFAKGGIKMQYLKTWKSEEADEGGSLYLLFTPPDESNGPAKISVEIDPAKGKSLEQYAQYTKDLLKQRYADFEAKPDKQVKIGDVNALLLEGEYTGEGGVKKHGRALLAVIDDAGYTVVYSNAVDKFDVYKKLHKYMCENLLIAGKPQFTQPQEITIGELERTELKEYGLAIQIPKGWQTGWGDGFWQAYSAADPNGHVATLTISLENAKGRNLDKIVEDGKKSLAESVAGYKELSSDKTITAGDLKGRLIVYNQDIPDGTKYRVGVGVFLKDKYAYYVFCAYTDTEFDKVQPGFDNVLKSFEVTGPPQVAENNNEGNNANTEGDDWDTEDGSNTGENNTGNTGESHGENTTTPDNNTQNTGDEWGDEGENNGGNTGEGANTGTYDNLPVKVGELKRREFADYGMALKVPTEWTDAPITGGLTINSAPDDQGHIAQVIITTEAGNGRTLDKIVQDGKAYFEQNVAGFQVVSEDPFSAGGVDGKMIVYDQDTPSSGKYRVSVAIFLKNDKVYDVYCAYTVGRYDKLTSLFNDIHNSFEIPDESGGDEYGGCDYP